MKNLLHTSILGIAMALLSVNGSYAQIKGDPQMKGLPAPLSTSKFNTSKVASKVSPALVNLQKDYSAGKVLGKASPGSDALQNLMQIRGDKVLVDFTAKGDAEAARAELQKMGVTITSVYGRVLSGLVPISLLSKLESSNTIRFAKPAFKPRHQGTERSPKGIISSMISNTGPSISQGDTAQLSYLARNNYKVSGKGVKVGILSDSYDNLGTAGVGVTTGELPGPGNPFGFTTPVHVISDLPSGGIDEGRAMAEIVHDVAPAADLAFYTAFNGEADFANGIQALADDGCKVIADDVIYFDEPYFQDGIVAQSVDMAKKKGVTYFSSAGNQSRKSYEYEYHPTNVEPLGPGVGTAHNFSNLADPPRYFQPLYIPTGGGVGIISLQWDQSSYSASGVGPDSDLDIYLLDVNGNIVAYSFDDNIASGEPVEILGYQNFSTSPTFFLLILQYSGPKVSRLKYLMYDNLQFYLTNPPIPGILAPTLFGHAKADGCIATAAAFYLQTPPYGVDPALVEPFSSLGGVANYFDIWGKRIKPLLRMKPNFTAPDGGNTSFFPPFPGQDIRQDVDAFPNFFGTSAAAPHAAGAAALIIEAYGKKKKIPTPNEVRDILKNTTSDMDNPYTPGFDNGFDYSTGYGLINVNKAVGKVTPPVAASRTEHEITGKFEKTEDARIVNMAEVYPNPSSKTFKVYLSLPGVQPANIELLSADGRKLQSKTVSQTKGVVEIDANGYRPGVYLLNVKQGSFTKTIRVIKQ